MTYEYTCQKCGHAFEKVQPITSAALTVCPRDVCPKKTWGKGKVKRAVGGGAGLLFKGSGFYITDYRSENYKASAKKEAGSSSSSSGSSSEGAKKESKTSAAPAPAASSAPASSTPAPAPKTPKKD
jgi:putative FmdB family regulatory protein